MENTVKKKNIKHIPKMRIAQIIFKDKDGNIIGECNNEHTGYKTG